MEITERSRAIGPYLVNEDGEIIGDTGEGFDAEWVMELRMEEEAEIKALQLRQAALIENIERMKKVHENRLKYLEWKYGQALLDFARNNLKGKSKTWKCPFGGISFRDVPSLLIIDDPVTALATARELGWPIRVEEKVMISEVRDKVEALLETGPVPGFAVREKRETVIIATGIERQ